MAAKLERTKQAGVYRAHTRACVDGRSKCDCPYQAMAWSAKEDKPIRKHFASYRAACDWRSDASGAIKAGKMKSPTKTTVQDAADKLVAGMRDGSIYDRSGNTYKPSTVRSYERALRLYVLPEFGPRRLCALERREVQALVERLHANGKAASSIGNALDPLRVICRRALRDGELQIDPTVGLELPRNRGRRDRVASRDEARKLIAALPESERGMWSLAFYTGLRRGELRGLRWSDVDLAAQPAIVHVRRTWDDNDGEVAAKSEAGHRDVPLPTIARDALVLHGLATGRTADDLVFGRTGSLPFIPTTVRSRALRAWGWKQVRRKVPGKGPSTTWEKRDHAALDPLTPHEARHCAASYYIEAGLNDLELTATIGHSDSRTTKAIYGHLFPDSGATIAAKMDAYHEAEAA